LSVDAQPKQQSAIARLVLAIAGVLLMVGPPYAFRMLNLVSRFQNTTIGAIELPCLLLGFVLLYVSLRERTS
jgi:uncharacterized protein YjeT (DUF2065 family)